MGNEERLAEIFSTVALSKAVPEVRERAIYRRHVVMISNCASNWTLSSRLKMRQVISFVSPW